MTVVVSQQTLTWQAAGQICRAAAEHAQSIGVKVNVSVCDSGGNPLAFQRMNGAFLHSISIAGDKAYAAVSFGMSTGKWQGIFAESPELRDGLLNRPRFVSLAGGLPIEAGGQIVGGVGVSGASEAQDEACASAGLAAIKFI